MKSTYRVIEILDEYSVIINYGATQGAKEDDEVRIIEKGPEIIDPLSNKVLGTLDSIKSTLYIITVYQNFSVCQNIEEVVTNALFNPLAQMQITKERTLSLNVNKKDISNKKAPQDSIIRVGDSVEIL